MYKERITDDISEAKIIVFERIKIINKFLLTGFEVTGMVK